jgi:hypothetical protein
MDKNDLPDNWMAVGVTLFYLIIIGLIMFLGLTGNLSSY